MFKLSNNREIIVFKIVNSYTLNFRIHISSFTHHIHEHNDILKQKKKNSIEYYDLKFTHTTNHEIKKNLFQLR